MLFHRTILIALALLTLAGQVARAQVTERRRPAAWSRLVAGARFVERFRPMEGSDLRTDVWGADSVRPRLVDNGIEDNIFSYWGGNIVQGDDGQWHHYVAAWLEASPKGHMEWPQSYVAHAVGPTSHGPFRNTGLVGKGHNPEVYRAADGTYVLYVIDARYTAPTINGPWTRGTFDFDTRDRRIIEGLSNLSFARREDGSVLMVDRGGGIWVSRDGLDTFHLLTTSRIYPAVEGRFEDPVIWRDSVQYHLIVNDWLGRIAFYLRSADGLHWVTDPGEAYVPGIARHADGTEEHWFKYERMRVVQDAQGRAVQANFAVIDTLKKEDRPCDRHSSKNICLPLDPGLLLALEHSTPVTQRTRAIRLRIRAEEGFEPARDLDLASLRFGASEAVNYGRGAAPLRTETVPSETLPDAHDLIATFAGAATELTAGEFAPKLLVRRADGTPTFGFVRQPSVTGDPATLGSRTPLLSARRPQLTADSVTVVIENFGQTTSRRTRLTIEADGKPVATTNLQPLAPYATTTLRLPARPHTDAPASLIVRIGQNAETFSN